MFKFNNKDTRTTPLSLFWCLYCYLLIYFTPCFSVSIVNFEQENTGWGISQLKRNQMFNPKLPGVYEMVRHIKNIAAVA